jgi:hypothetical protein
MRVDPDYLRSHYASLSDEALQEIDRADLVEIAKACYDQEVTTRRSSHGKSETGGSPARAAQVEPEHAAHGDKPDWIEDGSEVYSAAIFPGSTVAKEIDEAREVLESEGIPCFVDVSEPEAGGAVFREPNGRWRLLVPGNLNLRASSVLERDIFNTEFIDTWKTHLEMLPDEDLLAAQPELVFCGLFDRIERVITAYQQELSRRRLKS